MRSTIGIKPKQRGTLRARSGLRRIDHTVEQPDRPEIRGMLAEVPHLVRVEEVRSGRPSMKIHDLKPAPGSQQGAHAASAAASPARAARPPAAA